ncbi:RNA 2',3'-cyclic phosphodiesterase [Alkalilimnicola ehrlichii MLHE-1]|uniref:RNA 2',3'-cyclic phosphodiesterase n=1 Tax=Alkalilimnicola ehrlichii (strain ATCC BAA-1101 / DSM 17681 / MLHE-1) TaxID=187272 RepID=Q0ABC1_ALKEH|nr:RNA 2',3'-cyclic phosphodiesterase [Alkalilimnicola ehrlichii]ABI55866.1 2'-5' RNA ligase [Alkalilimnicola ehrlichii MLHE-1]
MDEETPATTRHRVFFALWPDEALRDGLARLARSLRGGRPVPRGHLHLTLAFAGLVTAEQVACLQRAAAGVRAPAFTLRLQTLGGFARARVAHVAPDEQDLPPALPELAGQLNRALVACGVPAERRGFRPHVTLRRDARPPRPRSVSLPEWSVDRFVLVESGDRGRPGPYRVLAEWLLQRSTE